MSLEEAAEYALAREEEPATPASPAQEGPSADQPPPALTPRKKEVALLVAQELTNRQIASTLTLSQHTVATHVRNVLNKLGLHSRNQVAAWVREHQPLP
jgi:DNA-binding NarL/FixJ family response regulator